jgi:hypothetical protein
VGGVRRSVLPTFFFLLAPLVLPSSATPAENRADRVNCTGYPEPRIYLENQSWWEPQARDPADPDHPGTGKQGHIHVGTCFPLYQRLSGDTLRLDIKLQLHNMTGVAMHLRIDAYGDYHHEVPRATWTGDPNQGWHCETTDCEKWVSVDFPLSRVQYRGDHEFMVFLIVWKSDASVKQNNISRWHAYIDLPRPEPASDSIVAKTRQEAWIGTGGDTWHPTVGGGKYGRVGMMREDVPWNELTGRLKTISGIWRPRINFEKQKNFVYVDPHLHAVPPHKGTVVWEQMTTNTGYVTKRFAINTRTLKNGLHRLVFGTGNVTPGGINTGVGVIPFRVRNPRR